MCVRVCVGAEAEDLFFVFFSSASDERAPIGYSTPTQDVTHIVAVFVFDCYFLFLSLVTLVCGFESGPERSFGTMTVKVGCFDKKKFLKSFMSEALNVPVLD